MASGLYERFQINGKRGLCIHTISCTLLSSAGSSPNFLNPLCS